MSREYTLFGKDLSVVGATTIVAIGNLASGSAAEFLRYWAGQRSSTTSAQQPIALATIATTIGLTSSTANSPVAIKTTDPASKWAGSTTLAQAKTFVNAASEGTGVKVDVWADVFNILNGFLKVNTPLEAEWTSSGAASATALYFPATPGSLTSWSFGWTFREVG